MAESGYIDDEVDFYDKESDADDDVTTERMNSEGLEKTLDSIVEMSSDSHKLIDWRNSIELPDWILEADDGLVPNEVWILEVTESGNPASRVNLNR